MGTILDLTMGAFRPVQSKRAASSEPPVPLLDRQRLEQELRAVRRKELELMRAIVVADHPQLGEALTVLETHMQRVVSAQQQLAEGLSESDRRRHAELTELMNGLKQQRADLNLEIEAHECELRALGEERSQRLQFAEREALHALATAHQEHERSLLSAGANLEVLLPGLLALLATAQADDERLSELVLDEELELSDRNIRFSSPPALP